MFAKYYFKTKSFRGMKFLQRFNFAVFGNNFWISLHSHFIIWLQYQNSQHFSSAILMKIKFFVREFLVFLEFLEKQETQKKLSYIFIFLCTALNYKRIKKIRKIF